MSERLSAEQWSRFWQKGSITTFIGRFANNYDGPVRDFWFELFETLPSDASIVDLATGNGGLALLAQQFGDRNGRSFQVTGIDYASIDPAGRFAHTAYARYVAKIRFLRGTPIEDTGLDKASCDVVISQFGFEYGDLERSIAEVARIAKPSAVFAAMIHHVDSAIIRQANDGIEQIIICEKSDLHEHVTDLLKRLDRLAARGKDVGADDTARDMRERVNRSTGALHAQAERYPDPGQIKYFAENSMAVFQPQFARLALENKLAMLREVNTETTAYRRRMRDLVSAARAEVDIEALISRLEKKRFEIERSQPFMFEDVHFCHVLVARRDNVDRR